MRKRLSCWLFSVVKLLDFPSNSQFKNQNKNSIADWLVWNLRGKKIKTKRLKIIFNRLTLHFFEVYCYPCVELIWTPCSSSSKALLHPHSPRFLYYV